MLMTIPAMAVENGYYIGPESGVDLRLAPRSNAAVSGHLNGNTEVEVIDRDRNWTKIQTIGHGAIRGWVPAGAVRKNYSSKSSSRSSSFLSSFASLFHSSDPEQKTAVLGVRGLDSGDGGTANVKASRETLKIVKWMDTLNVPEGEVAAFVKEGKLKP